MTVTVTWLLLLVLAVAVEIASRRSRGRWTPLTVVVARLWGGRAGRAALVVLWVFVGWHLFARHGVPA